MPPERREDVNIQDAHRIVQCRERPDHFWCQHHNGIFVSTNDLDHWEFIGPRFGFGVAVHPKDPAKAWFVPAIKDELRVPQDGHFVASRTRDGGQNFETLSSGLPAGFGYDLVLRHALDIDDRPATPSPSARPPAISMSPRTRATTGTRSRTTCRRCMLSGLRPVDAVDAGRENALRLRRRTARRNQTLS